MFWQYVDKVIQIQSINLGENSRATEITVHIENAFFFVIQKYPIDQWYY